MERLEPTDSRIIYNGNTGESIGEWTNTDRLRAVLQDLLETEDLGLVQTKEIEQRFGVLFK